MVWEARYRAAELGEHCPGDSFQRVARALARPEGARARQWERYFHDLMADNRFLPGGRILANAGRGARATLANCFVAGPLRDSLRGIFHSLGDCALTLRAGGGIGVDFSALRPRGAPARRSGQVASGPVPFIALWNQMSDTLLADSPRQGAMMGVLADSHPDIAAFIAAKREPGALAHFNLSVLVSDAFMAALAAGGHWPLRFGGHDMGRADAATLWRSILTQNLAGGEPGLLFIDRINRGNRLHYREHLHCTNPCGELPLPAHGSCVLGSLVLPTFVRAPFTARASLDTAALEDSTASAVRLLDNALERARLPLPGQRREARETRRIGIGLTGLADTLAMLGLPYDSDAGRKEAAAVAANIRHAACDASCELAREKGAFPTCDAAAWLDTPDLAPLPAGLAARIRRQGLRNSHLTAIAPTGSISLLAGCVSSGVEPIFDWSCERQMATAGGSRALRVGDHAVSQWRAVHGDAPLPAAFRRAADLDVADQVAMVAALQPWVDSGISKTVALPPDTSPAQLDTVYRQAWSAGLKGIAAYPASAARGAVLGAGCDAGGEACRRGVQVARRSAR